MAVSILVTSGKGGTGKSTVSQLLARAFTEMNRNVLLLELDCGLRGLDLSLAVSDGIVYDLSDVLLGRCQPSKAITEIPTTRGNFHFICAPYDRYFQFSVASLKAVLEGFAGCYDYMILDTCAGLGNVFDCARDVCDLALVVTNCEPPALRCAATTVRELGADYPTRLVINSFRTKQLNRNIPNLDVAIDIVQSQLISVIPYDLALTSSIAVGEYKDSCIAAAEVYDMAKRIAGIHVLLNQKRLK